MKIYETGASDYLQLRWMCCYLLYDSNLRHMESALFSAEGRWKERADSMYGSAASTGDCERALTDAYCSAISADIEDFIRHHLSNGKLSRAEFEAMLAEEIQCYTKEADIENENWRGEPT